VLGSSLTKYRKRLFGRKALQKKTLPYYIWRFGANTRRTIRAALHGSADPDIGSAVAALRSNGIVVGACEKFLKRQSLESLARASSIVLAAASAAEVENSIAKGRSDNLQKDFMIPLVPWDMEHGPDSPFLKLALDTKLLEIVSQYLGMWPQLHAIGGWIHFPTADSAKKSQLWHRDPEDFSITKVFIYLNDVGPDTGPFSYVPGTQPFGRRNVKASKSPEKHITDEEMEKQHASDSWLVCTGPAGTMILADTVGFHRGGKPKCQNRILITFTYTSGAPINERPLRVTHEPDWIDNEMQRYALR
jgi:hypothetical protein